MKHWKKVITLCLVIGVVMALALPLWAEEVAKVNINQASVEELVQLKGIGLEYGQRIVQYREEHGAFQKAEDIMNVSGIGPKTFEEIKDRITVE
jgi:competence protein ComEA